MSKLAETPSPEVQIRIDHVCDLMRSMQFKRGETVKRLAKEWDLSLDYCKEITARASKIVKQELANADDVTVDVAATMRKIMHDAIDADPGTQPVRCAIEAAKLLAAISGANAPVKHEVTTTVEASPSRALELVRAAFGGQVAPVEPTALDPSKP